MPIFWPLSEWSEQSTWSSKILNYNVLCIQFFFIVLPLGKNGPTRSERLTKMADSVKKYPIRKSSEMESSNSDMFADKIRSIESEADK